MNPLILFRTSGPTWTLKPQYIPYPILPVTNLTIGGDPMPILTASAPFISAVQLSPSSSSSSSDDPAPSLPTRVILPKKKPEKWSTGVAPGEYGGPPTTTKLRKYWGGPDNVDPVTATDDFIWNKDFLKHMQRLVDPQEPTPPFSLIKEPSEGFLSLNRAMNLDRVEIDLSKELKPLPKPVLEQQVEAARRGLPPSASSSGGALSPRWRLAPTRRELAKWDRASKAATGGTDFMLRESKKPRGDPVLLAKNAREQYFKLKRELQTLTLGIGGVGIVSAYVSYSPEIAVSFGAGLLGSLAYIRMLGNTVDSMADGARGLIKGAAGQPRLLVPVALVMIYSRWNGILVPDYGFMHLELIPMLVGFFTYKIATFAQALQEAVSIVENKSQT